MRVLRGRYTRSFVQMTDSDIAQRIAQELGFASNIKATSEVQEYRRPEFEVIEGSPF